METTGARWGEKQQLWICRVYETEVIVLNKNGDPKYSNLLFDYIYTSSGPWRIEVEIFAGTYILSK